MRALHDDSSRFPSYLRLFDIFFGLLISESYSGTARLFARLLRAISHGYRPMWRFCNTVNNFSYGQEMRAAMAAIVGRSQATD